MNAVVLDLSAPVRIATGALASVLAVYLIARAPISISSTQRSPNFWKVSGLVGGTVCVAAIIGCQILWQIDTLPYNLRELIGSSWLLTPTILTFVLLTLGAVPFIAARVWLDRPTCFVLLVAPAVGLAGAITFVSLLGAVPLESIDDIVGTPIWDIGPNLERGLRFLALYGGVVASLTLGMRITFREFGPHFWSGSLAIAAIGFASFVMVVPLAVTDNVIELLRGSGWSPLVLGLPCILVLLGATSVIVLAAIQRASRGDCKPLVMSALLVATIAIANWQLFVASTNPRLEKYGQVFAARQFLLSADRDHYLPDRMIFVRFAMTVLSVVVIIAAGIFVVLAGTTTQLSIGRRNPALSTDNRCNSQDGCAP